jgi:hypothetical protein
VDRIEVKGEKAGVEGREAEGGQGRRLEVKGFLISISATYCNAILNSADERLTESSN